MIHRLAWLWEPLERHPTFLLRSMFGTKAVYLGGKLLFCFSDREEPWRGVLVGTDRSHHASLVAEFTELAPHPVLPKWLYLPETARVFEDTATRLVQAARRGDPRLGVTPSANRKKSRPSARERP